MHIYKMRHRPTVTEQKDRQIEISYRKDTVKTT